MSAASVVCACDEVTRACPKCRARVERPSDPGAARVFWYSVALLLAMLATLVVFQ